VWDALAESKAARFPFPVRGRIPNFEGAKEAAERLPAHPIFHRVRVMKVNPDSPQRWVRKLALERNITVITPTPRLKGAFRKLDPEKIPKEHYWSYPRSVDGLRLGIQAVHCGGWGFSVGHILLS
jgi:5-formyltetrahydrofolate cyclo-ligase